MNPVSPTFSRLSLTPTLSRREREKHSPSRVQSSDGDGPAEIRATGGVHWLSPLPAGEGQGEGELHKSEPTLASL